MDKRKIVVTGAAFPDAVTRQLAAAGFVVEFVAGDLPAAEVVEALQGAWGYALGGSEHMGAGVWAKIPSLKVVCFLGTGYSSFMQLPQADTGIRFTYTPHANAGAVAEFALAQMLDVVRGLTRRTVGVRAGRWDETPTPSLVGARLGVAGMGHVGRQVAEMARAAFGADVYYWNRTRRRELDLLPYTRASTLTDLCGEVDVVALCFAHSPGANDGVFGAAQLAALGPAGYVVNVARAALVDPLALRAALSAGQIAGAAFDGYYVEPTPSLADDPYGLLQFIPDKLLVTPHCAYLSRQAVAAMAGMAAENFLAVGRGCGPAPYEIARV